MGAVLTMYSILVIKPQDTINYDRKSVHASLNDLRDWLKESDNDFHSIRYIDYIGLETYGKDPRDIAQGLCRIFEPEDEVYVYVAVTDEWIRDDVIDILKNRCERVVQVKVEWVGVR